MKPFSVRRGAAFTLVELLVVVAIVAILSGMLLPALGNAKSKAVQTACLRNTKQLALAWHLYAKDFNDGLVGCDRYSPINWIAGNMVAPTDATNLDNIRTGLLYPFNSSVGIYHCPADHSTATVGRTVQSRVRSYSINSYMNGSPDSDGNGYKRNKKLCDVRYPDPSDAITFVCEDEESIDDGHFGFNPDPGTKVWVNLPALTKERHGSGSMFAYADGHSATRRWVNKETLKLTGVVQTDRSSNGADLLWMKEHIATKP